MRKISYTIISVSILSLISSLYYMNSELVKLESKCKDMESIIDLNSRTLIGVYEYLVEQERQSKSYKQSQLVDNQRVVNF
jgi:hypothetical protein